MEDSSIKILDRLDILTLERLKNEAELIFDDLIATENIIINKANNFFQILIVMLVSLIGYLISQLPRINFHSYLIQAALIFTVCLSLSIGTLLKIIYPTKIKLKGSTPSSLLKSDIFDGSAYETENLLSNRVLSLDRDIYENRINQTNRMNLFKRSVWFTMYGILAVIISTIINLYV